MAVLAFIVICVLLSLATIGCGTDGPMEPSFTKIQPVPVNQR